MKIKSIKPVGRKRVYDLSIASDDYDHQQYTLENGVISHNTGIYYSADNIWILGRQQDKKQGEREVKGYHFIINIEKSRFVKEKSRIPISVSWEKGVERWSGLLEVAVAGGFVDNSSKGWYCAIDQETGEVGAKVREKDTHTSEFWAPIINNKKFQDFVEAQYSIGHDNIVDFDDIVQGETLND